MMCLNKYFQQQQQQQQQQHTYTPHIHTYTVIAVIVSAKILRSNPWKNLWFQYTFSCDGYFVLYKNY